MESITGVLTAFGVSAVSPLNVYLSLLIVALLARFTSLVNLNPSVEAMTSIWVIILLAALFVWELVADKVPVLDNINDIAGTFIRPAAGGIIWLANNNVITDYNPILAFILGIFIAGGVHAAKATGRGISSATTGGSANPVISSIEDIAAGVGTILSIVLPFAVPLVLAIVAFFAIRWWRRRQRGKKGVLGVQQTNENQTG